jgi:hypothetical protein
MNAKTFALLMRDAHVRHAISSNCCCRPPAASRSMFVFIFQGRSWSGAAFFRNPKACCCPGSSCNILEPASGLGDASHLRVSIHAWNQDPCSPR